jgi:hypothetical protein
MAGPRCEPEEPGLAILERRRPQLLAVELEQIERIEEDMRVVRLAVQLLEDRKAGLGLAPTLPRRRS